MVEQSEIPPHVIGGIVYATALAQSVVLALANEGVIPVDGLAEHLDVVALQWDQAAADPHHPIPEVLKDARDRLSAFMKLLDGVGAELERSCVETGQFTPHELRIADLFKRAARAGRLES